MNESDQKKCADAREKDRTLGNIFSCFDPQTPEGTAVIRETFRDELERLAYVGLMPPGGVLGLGLAVFWILSGFKNRKAS